MPIVPEKLSSRHGSRSAITNQFWESAEHSTRYIDGQVWELPCEPPALNLTGSSGLSRSQQLIAAQSMGVPVIPSYDSNSGGVVRYQAILVFVRSLCMFENSCNLFPFAQMLLAMTASSLVILRFLIE